MSKDVVVRVAGMEDLDVLVEMMVELRNLEVSKGRAGYVDDYREFVRLAVTYVYEILKDKGRFVVIVAEIHGQVVGGTIAEIEPLEMFFDPPVQGNILMMVVKPEHKQSRVGTRMLGAIEAILYEAGVRRISASCYQANLEPQWGLVRHGYEYEYITLVRYMDGSSVGDKKPPEDEKEQITEAIGEG